MKTCLTLAGIFGLIFSSNYIHGQDEPVSMCDFVNISVSSADTGYANLYHPGFFLFGATQNIGGYDNECFWTVSSMGGDILHEAVTIGDWASQSFMIFEHEVALDDSMLVELVLTSPLEEFDCCMMDTLVWVENNTIPQFPWGNWDFVNLNVGADCMTATGVDDFKTYAAPSFFPQPASDRFWIDDLANIAKLDLYNLSGKRVAEFSVESRNQSFEIQGLPNGIYFVKMLDGRSHVVGVQRLIKSALD